MPSALRFLLVSYWPVRNSIVWPENSLRQAASALASQLAWPGLLADIDAVAVRVGHDKAAQPVVGVARAFDDPDPVLLVQGCASVTDIPRMPW